MRFHREILVLVLPVVASCQEPAPARPFVRASGEAVVYSKPDRARIEFRVVTEATTAQAAAAQNATKTQAAMAGLRAAIGGKAALENSDYSLSPEYDYHEGRGRPTVRGYSAASSLALTTEDLGSVARLVDAATAAGPVEISRIQFTTKDATAARTKALRAATRIARGYAEALAAAQGVKLGDVLSLDGVTPPEWTAPSALNSAAMPGEGESVAVHASVVLTIAIERTPEANR